jgi:hypothetical protein
LDDNVRSATVATAVVVVAGERMREGFVMMIYIFCGRRRGESVSDECEMRYDDDEVALMGGRTKIDKSWG